ncbi:MerR family transcriptional regulator [Azospirillum palustre]|uniref:MerR family transcriptional regulator n=1 Tax=Azospirillum palustre TaxID=2044885 RepID=A0A2B8B6F3_9PROT|nr:MULTISPECIES: helix-turn-helix domain-containing protein [Azospirillum]KAA0577776.1 helix-turn-helix domain-containing protein [Azospirillum sp. B21]PGH56864.1 MerR family transcriptional regulator [Azospirillum palustre]
MKPLTIGELSAQAGVKIPTIRYYESIGLLPAPLRTDSNRRTYDAAAVSRLRFIRHARELGFEVDAIRQLLMLADDPAHPCGEADALARAHLADIESKIARLQALRAEVRNMVEPCPQGQVRTCHVIEVLADHSHCLHDHH